MKKYRLVIIFPVCTEIELYTNFTSEMHQLYQTTRSVERAGGRWMLEVHSLNGGLEIKLTEGQLIPTWWEA